MRNLSDKELDAVCGGWGFTIRTGRRVCKPE